LIMVKIQMGREKKRAHHTKNKRLGLPFQVISLESIMSLFIIVLFLTFANDFPEDRRGLFLSENTDESA